MNEASAEKPFKDYTLNEIAEIVEADQDLRPDEDMENMEFKDQVI